MIPNPFDPREVIKDAGYTIHEQRGYSFCKHGRYAILCSPGCRYSLGRPFKEGEAGQFLQTKAERKAEITHAISVAKRSRL